MIFLGLASNFSAKDLIFHSFCLGTKKDYRALELELSRRYSAPLDRLSLIYSGRSALSLALKSLISSKKVHKGDHVAINSFSCFAVVQAVKSAGLIPIFLDLEKLPSGEIRPDYSPDALERARESDSKLKVFIIQNSFGFPVDIRPFEKLKQSENLYLIEDLAHCAGRVYPDGREIGTVGDAACLSFGKGKAIDTTTGGAVILRNPDLTFPSSFKKSALVRRRKTGDVPRASWYPLFGATARGLSHLRLEKIFLGLLLKLKWIERSADTKLDESTTITYWQAKSALRQLSRLKKPIKSPLREYFLVDDREACLAELKTHGLRLEEVWYDVPIAPARYFNQINFPKDACPNAVFFADHVVNLPTWYHDKHHLAELKLAKKIIKHHALTPEKQ